MEPYITSLQKAIELNNQKIKQAKEVLEFPTYLLGVQEGLQWALRLIKKEDWCGK